VLSTLAFSHVAGLAFQASLAFGFVLAVTTHFVLQRVFVWTHHGEFALPVKRQLRRYIVIAVVQYALTACVTSTLPGALGLPTDLVYVATAACVAVGNFALFRSAVFHAA
jgi:putative flippase GtrA